MESHAVTRRSVLLGWLPFLPPLPIEVAGIEFRVLPYAHSPRRYLVIHGDESTARDVLTAYMNDHDGVAYLVTGLTRNVQIEGAQLDPNRMFSREGAHRSLLSLNPGINPDRLLDALDRLDRDREKLLRHLIPPKGSRLFALHNNRDYSVQDELAASDRTSIKQPAQPRNFFLCTDPADFDV